MSTQSESWKVPSNECPPEQFWLDFGKFVNASKQYEDSDYYWSTLVWWADVLMKKYDANMVVCHIVMDYIDGQSKRSLNGKPREIA